jgi:hypothetical protein
MPLSLSFKVFRSFMPPSVLPSEYTLLCRSRVGGRSRSVHVSLLPFLRYRAGVKVGSCHGHSQVCRVAGVLSQFCPSQVCVQGCWRRCLRSLRPAVLWSYSAVLSSGAVSRMEGAFSLPMFVFEGTCTCITFFLVLHTKNQKNIVLGFPRPGFWPGCVLPCGGFVSLLGRCPLSACFLASPASSFRFQNILFWYACLGGSYLPYVLPWFGMPVTYLISCLGMR